MSGISAAIGYAVFTLLGWLVGLVLARFDVTISAAARRIAWIALGVVAAIVVVVGGLWMCGRWQNQQRSMLLMDDLGWWFGIPMLVVAAIVAIILALIGRLVGRGVVHLHRLFSRVLSPTLAAFATVIAVVLIGWFVFNDVAFASFRDWANSAFSTVDDGTADGIEQPRRRHRVRQPRLARAVGQPRAPGPDVRRHGDPDRHDQRVPGVDRQRRRRRARTDPRLRRDRVGRRRRGAGRPGRAGTRTDRRVRPRRARRRHGDGDRLDRPRRVAGRRAPALRQHRHRRDPVLLPAELDRHAARRRRLGRGRRRAVRHRLRGLGAAARRTTDRS